MRWVVLFLMGCALLGFFMGLKGALPRGEPGSIDSGPPAAPTDGVVIEAAPLEEAIVTPPAEDEEKAEAPKPEEKAEEPKAPEPKVLAPPPPAPKEEPPPADPVGDLLEAPAPPPDAVIY